MQIPEPWYPPSLISYVAVLMLLALSLHNLLSHGWVHREFDEHNRSYAVPAMLADSAPAATARPDEEPAQRKGKCDECAVIVSMASVESLGDVPGFEVAVRLTDKSIRLLTFASTANWRVGEHIILFGGED